MGLSTHVLDTMHGSPAAGMDLALYWIHEDAATLIKRVQLNAQGRPDAPLVEDGAMQSGTYRLRLEVGRYFRARGVSLPEPAFLEQVSIDFGVADSASHYHVPLLVSPWSYSTYRGS